MLELRLRARNDQDFVLTRDLSEAADYHNIPAGLIRMTLRSGGSVAYEWLGRGSAGARGIATYFETRKLARFTAPKASIANLSGDYSIVCQLILPDGVVTMFVGQINFRRGAVTNQIAVGSSDIYALGDTVAVAYEQDIPGTPVSQVSYINLTLDGAADGRQLMVL